MVKLLIIISLIIVIGVIFITILAIFAPKRLVTSEGQFRYGVAGFLIFAWWLSLGYFLLWSLSWPAKRIVSKAVVIK